MPHLSKKIAIFIATLSTTAICMEQPSSSHLFVQTSDNQITSINKNNIPHMYVLDVMATHQHKDFAFIDYKKRKINSYKNPLDASAITGLTGTHLQLLDKALDEHNNEKNFYNFYISLNHNEHAALLDAAAKVHLDTALKVQAEKIIILSHEQKIPQDIRNIIISFAIPQLPSIIALKQAILRTIPPITSELKGHTGFGGKALWNPDNSILISTNYISSTNSNHRPDEQLIIRNGHTGEPIKKFADTDAKNITFSPDGTRLCYVIDNGCLNPSKASLCDGHTGTNINTFEVNRESKSVFSPDSKTILVLNRWKPYVYNAETGDPIQTIKHTSFINNFAFTADSKHFISVGKGSHNEQIILWNINGEKIKIFKVADTDYPTPVTHIALSPDYSRLSTGSMTNNAYDPNLILRDGTTGKKIKKLKGHDRHIQILLFSPDNKCLLSGAYSSSSATIIIWNAQTGECIKKINAGGINFSTALIAFAQDNSFLIIDNTLYDTQSFEPIITLSAPEELFALAIKPDGNCIAAKTNNTLVLYTLFTDEILEIFNGIKSGITDLLQAYKLTQLCKKFGVKI